MDDPEKQAPAQHAQRLSQPPFILGSWAALAYVEGKYNPPSAKIIEACADDFLGIYVSKEDPGVALFTFTGAGAYMAFHRCGGAESTAEFAAVDAFIHYKIPFEQWRIYPAGAPEAEALQQLELRAVYDAAMKGLAAVLYQARLFVRPGRLELDPMFLISPRSSEAIFRDDYTDKAIRRSLLGEERATRYFENVEKLKSRKRQPPTDDKGV